MLVFGQLAPHVKQHAQPTFRSEVGLQQDGEQMRGKVYSSAALCANRLKLVNLLLRRYTYYLVTLLRHFS